MRRIMITGGMGFIGSNLIRYWLKKYRNDHVINLDGMTYAARPEWVDQLFKCEPVLTDRYTFERVDITNHAAVLRALYKLKPDHIIHLAAESHVCRSIAGPSAFVSTNFNGTFHLIEEFKELWRGHPEHRFHHVSTDEVFGQLGHEGHFTELSPIRPRSPYSCTKASSDLLVKTYQETYGVNTVITNCSNNFGPNQHLEKLIPKAIKSVLNKELMTVYGQGDQVRDWLWVEDHCSAIDAVFHHGKSGERYCIGGDLEKSNLEVIKDVHSNIVELLNNGLPMNIVHTADRPTDDFRYAVDCSKLKALGWSPKPELFNERLKETIKWYLERGFEYPRGVNEAS